jgi:hypothetical protein
MYKQITENPPVVDSHSVVTGRIEKAAVKGNALSNMLLKATGNRIGLTELKGKESTEVKGGVVLSGAMKDIEGGDTGFVEIPGKTFSIELGMTASDPNYHEPMDSVGGMVMAVRHPRTGQEFEVAMAVLADGVSKVNDDPAQDSAAISQIACRTGMKSIQEQIRRNGGYDMDETYVEIRDELRRKGLEHGATTFQLLIVTPSEKRDDEAIAIVYSFGSKKDMGPVLFYGPDGQLDTNASRVFGQNEPNQFVTNSGRPLNYDVQGYRVNSGASIVLTTDGNLNPDDLTGSQRKVKNSGNFGKYFRTMTGQDTRADVNPDDTSLVRLNIKGPLKKVTSITK